MQELLALGCLMFVMREGDHRLCCMTIHLILEIKLLCHIELCLSQCVACVLLYHDMICATLHVGCSVLFQICHSVVDANEHTQGFDIEPSCLYSPTMIGMIPVLVVADAPVDEHL